jgi:hypothetical protein
MASPSFRPPRIWKFCSLFSIHNNH